MPAAYHKRYIAARGRNESPKRLVRTYRQSVVAEKAVCTSLSAAAYHKRSSIAARGRNEFPKRAVRTYRESVVGEKW